MDPAKVVRVCRAGLVLGIVEALVVLGLVIGCAKAFAQETWVAASVASYHSQRDGYCEFNPGLGFERPVSKNLAVVGGWYANSLCANSHYLGVQHTWVRWGRWTFGPSYTYLTGYGKPAIVPIPVFGYHGKEWGANVIFVTAGEKENYVFAFQIKKTLKSFLE